MAGTDSSDESIFKVLSADDDDQRIQIESLCTNCGDNGITRLMCTRIPFYRQVLVISFACEHCGFRNNELQSGEPVQEHGTEIVLRVRETADLNRQLVKSEFASVEIPELELLIEPMSQPGEVTTVEGVLNRVRAGLEQDQCRRREEDPDGAAKIDQFIDKLEVYRSLEKPFTLKLKDASGNCFLQNPDPFHVDPRCITVHYRRTIAETKMLGLAADDRTEEEEEEEPAPEWKSFEDAASEVLRFPTDCPNCGARTETCMKPTRIPYFSTVIIMATCCEVCGMKTNEVKSGGAIRDQGCRLTVSIEEEVDLARDVLKSDTCSMAIPELEVEVGPGALASRFTTVEGILSAARDQIKDQGSFFLGDSSTGKDKSLMHEFLAKFDDVIALRRKARLVLDDPAGNSYIQSLTAPLDDPRLQKEFYVRTFEQNDELGLNDMKTENYGELGVVAEEEEDGEIDGHGTASGGEQEGANAICNGELRRPCLKTKSDSMTVTSNGHAVNGNNVETGLAQGKVNGYCSSKCFAVEDEHK